MGNAKPPAHSGGRSPAGGESLKPAPDTLPCSSPVLGPARALLPAPPPTLGPAPPLVPPLGPAPALPPDPPHPRPGSCAWGVHSARVHQAALAGRAKPGLGVPLGGHRRWRAALRIWSWAGSPSPASSRPLSIPPFKTLPSKQKQKQKTLPSETHSSVPSIVNTKTGISTTQLWQVGGRGEVRVPTAETEPPHTTFTQGHGVGPGRVVLRAWPAVLGSWGPLLSSATR